MISDANSIVNSHENFLHCFKAFLYKFSRCYFAAEFNIVRNFNDFIFRVAHQKSIHEYIHIQFTHRKIACYKYTKSYTQLNVQFYSLEKKRADGISQNGVDSICWKGSLQKWKTTFHWQFLDFQWCIFFYIMSISK